MFLPLGGSLSCVVVPDVCDSYCLDHSESVRVFRLVDPSWASYALIAGSVAAAGLFPKQLVRSIHSGSSADIHFNRKICE